MSFSYSDTVIEQFDKGALEYYSPVIGCKMLWDEIFLVLPHSAEDINLFFNYINNLFW